MAKQTIFYSWQSDLPNALNRGFISNCLEQAIQQISSDDGLKVDPCLDRDTKDVPGTPDIVATIFEKIATADIFVGDVSFVSAGTGRQFPNPNVLIELGFAASSLGWQRIICVFNTHFGAMKDLPFDLRQRRIVSYKLSEDGEKSQQRKVLVSKLRASAKSIIEVPILEAERALHNLLSSVSAELINVIIFGQEFEERFDDPWLDSLRDQFQSSARYLADLALDNAARESGLDAELEALVDTLDKLANIEFEIGFGSTMSDLVMQAVELAISIKEQRITPIPLSDESIQTIDRNLESTLRKLAKLSSKIEELVEQCRYDDAKDEASELGLSILTMGHYNLDCIQNGLSKKLLNIGRNLHLVETIEIFADGGRSERKIVETIQMASKQFDKVLTSVKNRSL